MSLTWNWGTNNNNNGNLQSITASHGGPNYPQFLTFSTSFGYDLANRLTSAADVITSNNNAPAWSRNFSYDQYGNMWTTASSGVPVFGTMPNASTDFNPATNQLVSARYDAAGNQTDVGSYSVAYDAENRQTVAVDNVSEGQASYGYDGFGQRVTKSTQGSISIVYVYDIFGQLAAEYNNFPAQQSACTTCYLSVDHLGNTRLVTDSAANIISRHDYLPFGEEIPANTAGRKSEWGPFGDIINQKFTSQERDGETGFDFFQARYFYSPQGRFSSADPANAGADIFNPQSWNGYSYVSDRPLTAVDPQGLQIIDPSWYISAGELFSGAWASEMVSGLLQSGGAVQCPNNTCTAQIGNGLYQFNAYSNGLSGFVPLGQQPYEIKETVFGQTYTSYGNIIAAGTLDPFGIETHHLIPQEFEPLMPSGINIQDYTIQLPRFIHRMRPFGVHTGQALANWSAQWRQFVRALGRNPTLQEVERFTGSMLDALEEHVTAVNEYLEQNAPEVAPLIEELEAAPPRSRAPVAVME